MSKQQDALRLALEALKNIKHHFDTDEYAWEIANLALAKVGEQL